MGIEKNSYESQAERDEAARVVEATRLRIMNDSNTGKIIHPEGPRVLPERLGQPTDRKKQEVEGDRLG
jgi:hypothetical protein